MERLSGWYGRVLDGLMLVACLLCGDCSVLTWCTVGACRQ